MEGILPEESYSSAFCLDLSLNDELTSFGVLRAKRSCDVERFICIECDLASGYGDTVLVHDLGGLVLMEQEVAYWNAPKHPLVRCKTFLHRESPNIDFSWV